MRCVSTGGVSALSRAHLLGLGGESPVLTQQDLRGYRGGKSIPQSLCGWAMLNVVLIETLKGSMSEGYSYDDDVDVGVGVVWLFSL